MRILGIESSCDETAAAVVENGERLLSNVVHSQIDIHAEYGGVVPEVAARSHIEMINPVITKALTNAGCTWDDIDAIAVTYAPGLIGSLLVGTLVARTLAILHHKPLYAIHHVEAHVYANFIVEQGWNAADSSTTPELTTSTQVRDISKNDSLRNKDRLSIASSAAAKEADEQAAPSAKPSIGASDTPLFKLSKTQPQFPLLALIVSGGHSQLVLFRNHGDYKLLGQTQDDAVGEAFDKVAKILGLPYPGGPAIATAALDGDANKYVLPKAKVQGAYDFSFSGLKTAVLRAVQREVGVSFTYPSHQLPQLVSERQRVDFAASFQRIAIETLVDKTQRAFDDYQPASVVIAGGVAANQELRRQLSEHLPVPIEYAPVQLCTDNAAMVASLGYYVALYSSPTSPYDLEAVPSRAMTAWRNVVKETTE